MENTKKKLKYKLIIKKYIYEIFQIAIGTFVMAIGTSLFLLPNKLSSGGFAGIATITYYLFNWNMGTVILLFNIPFFLLAFIRIGKKFVFKSIIGTTFLSFFIDILDKVKPLTNDKFLACIYGGIIIGIGTSIVLKAEGSTGGSDLVSYIIKSFKPGLLTSDLIVMFDFVVILLNVICFKQLEIGLYSAISIYLMGKIIDIVFEGIGFSKMVFIISKDYNEISNEIGSKVTRGVTGIYSKGMYTDKEKMMLMCIASRNEIIRIRQIANQIDSRAFIVITNVREVYGKGFK
jgi:uncharacterized membrane-anchored protein YitT (DUF2179 family)